MNKAWLYVVAGGIIEIFWAIFLKLSNGFTDMGYTRLTLVLVGVSFFLFAKGMVMLPSGIAYTVFTGIGAIGTIVFGIFFLGESFALPKIVFCILLIVGIIGLKMSSKEV